MRIRFAGTTLVGTTLLVALAGPSSAQDLGVGLSFLEGGTGVTVDYAMPHKALPNGPSLSGVLDVSFHREGFPGGSAFNTVTAQGGIRFGPTRGNLTWHVQGLVGFARVGISNSDEFADFCAMYDIECGRSRAAFLITPGIVMEYAFDRKRGLRVQLDLPIANGTRPGTRFWFGLAMKLGD